MSRVRSRGAAKDLCQNLSEGKAVAEGHRLPVVAEGLIPLIYRRAFFKHRATPPVIAPEEGPA